MRTICLARGEKYSPGTLAARSGVSAGLHSQIERGIENPSFQTLLRITSALKPADSYTVRSGQVHWLRNDQHTPAVMLTILSPGAGAAVVRLGGRRRPQAGQLDDPEPGGQGVEPARQRGAEPDLGTRLARSPGRRWLR